MKKVTACIVEVPDFIFMLFILSFVACFLLFLPATYVLLAIYDNKYIQI